MNKQVVVDVFSVYETIKDSMKVTRPSINKNLFTLHYQTDFFAEGKDDALDKVFKHDGPQNRIYGLIGFHRHGEKCYLTGSPTTIYW